MNSSIIERALTFLQAQRKKKIWYRLTTGMAAVVVFITTYMLILPAITMERDTICGLEAHVHSEDCYKTETMRVLNCNEETLQVHRHSEECYDEAGTLICEKEEPVILHTHDSMCYDSEGSLICTLKEVKAHTHDDYCYEQETICGQIAHEAHTHTSECYSIENVLVCTGEIPPPVSEGEILIDVESTETSSHVHTDSCYEQQEVLSCLIAEGPGHTHTASCYSGNRTLICLQEEVSAENAIVHQHTEECFTEVELEKELICGMEEHEHVEACYEAAETKAEPETAKELTTEITVEAESETATEIATEIETDTEIETEIETGSEIEVQTETETEVKGEEELLATEEVASTVMSFSLKAASDSEESAEGEEEGETSASVPYDFTEYITGMSGSGTSYDQFTDTYDTVLAIEFAVHKDTIEATNNQFTYMLPEGIIIPDKLLNSSHIAYQGEGANKIEGFEYVFKEVTVTNADGTTSTRYTVDITFLDSYMEKAEGLVSGSFKFDAQYTGSSVDSNGNLNLTVKDNVTLTIPTTEVDYGSTEETRSHNLDVSKTGSYIQGNKLYYTVEVVSTKGTPGAIKLTDELELSNGLTVESAAISSVTVQNWYEVKYYSGYIWKEAADTNIETVDVTGMNYSYNLDSNTLELTLPQVTDTEVTEVSNGIRYDGKKYTITYEIQLADLADDTAYTADNDVTAASEGTYESLSSTAEKQVTFTGDVLSKSGYYGNGYVNWTIQVNASGNNISGDVLTDDMLKEVKAEDIVISPDTGYTIEKNSDGTIASITFSSVDGDENRQKYTISYSVPRTGSWDAYEVTNNVVLDPSSETETQVTETAKVTVPSAVSVQKSLEATGSMDENERIPLTWEIDINLPSDGMPQVTVLQDTLTSDLAGSHYMTIDQIKAWAQYIGKDSIEDSSLQWLALADLSTLYLQTEDGNWISYTEALANSSDTKYIGFKFGMAKAISTETYGSTVSLKYDSYADVSDAQKDEQYTFGNSANAGEGKSDSKSFTYVDESNVIKMDGNGYSGDTIVSNSDGTVTWKVKINLDDNYGSLKIEDTLPDGVELVSIQYGDADSTETAIIDSDGNISAATGSALTFTNSTYSGSSVILNVSLSGDERPAYFSKDGAFWVTYVCKITNMPDGTTETYTLENNIKVTTDNNETAYGEDSQTQTHTVTTQKKVIKTDGSDGADTNISKITSENGIVSWYVKVYLEEDLNTTDTYTITDTLPHDADGKPLVTLTELSYGNPWKWEAATIGSGTGEVSVTGPDGTYVNLTGSTYDASTGKLVLKLKLKENLQWWETADYLKKGNYFYIRYSCKINDFAALESGTAYSYDLKNEVVVTKDGNSYGKDEHTQTYEGTIPQKVVKTDGNGYTDDRATSSVNGVLTWMVQVNLLDDFDVLKITDTLPEGVELISLSFGTQYSQITAAINEGSIEAPSDCPIDLSESTYSSNDDGTDTVYLQMQLKDGQTRPDYFSDGNTLYITYTCQIEALPTEEEKTKTYDELKNIVSVEADTIKYGNAEHTQTHTVTLPDKVEKMDASYSTKDSETYSSDGTIVWKVLVNLKEEENIPLTIVDQLPAKDNVALVELVSLSYGTDEDPYNAVISGTSISGDSNDTVLDLTGSTYNETTGEVILKVNVKSDQDTPEYLQQGGSFWVTYTCKIKDLPVTGTHEYELENKVEVSIGDTVYGEDDQKQDHTVTLPDVDSLLKDGEWDENTQIMKYSLTINPYSFDLISGSDWLTLTDSLKYSTDESLANNCKRDVEILQSSVRLYYATIDEEGNAVKSSPVPTALWSWIYNVDKAYDQWNNIYYNTHTITANIPDGQALILEYSYQVQIQIPSTWTDDWNSLKNQNLSMSNTAELSGVSDSKITDNSDEKYGESSTSGSVDSEAVPTYVFNKVDNSNFSNLLSGAEFTVYKYNASTKLYESTGYTYTTVKGTFTIQQDDDEGYGEYAVNTAYYVVETKAPDGYDLPDNPTKYYFHFTDSESTDLAYPTDFASVSSVDLSSESSTVYCGNTNIPTDTYTLTKQDKDTKEVLSGAEFELCVYDEDTVAYVAVDPAVTYTTDANGTIVVSWNNSFIFNKAYCLRETKAPSGYILPDEENRTLYEFYFSHTDTAAYPNSYPDGFNGTDLTRESAEEVCTNEKAPEGTYPFIKVDGSEVAEGESQTPLSGAEFTLFEYTGDTENPYQDTGIKYISAEDGTFTVKWESTAEFSTCFNTAYYIVETKAPSGYTLPANPDKYYFWFSNEDTTTYPLAKPDDFTGVDLSEQSESLDAVTVENTIQTTSVKANKVWYNADGTLISVPPTSVTVSLWRYALTEEEWNKQVESGTDSTELVSIMYNLLSQSDGSVLSSYTDAYVKGSELIVSLQYKGDTSSLSESPVLQYGENTYNNINVQTTELVDGKTFIYEVPVDASGTISVSVSNADQWVISGASVLVESEELADCLETTSLYSEVLNSSNSWAYEWTGLPICSIDENGTKTFYKYIIREADVEHYNKCISGGWDTSTGSYTYTVANTAVDESKLAKVSVTKVWEGDEESARPDAISVKLRRYRIPESIWTQLPESAVEDPMTVSLYKRENAWDGTVTYVNSIKVKEGQTLQLRASCADKDVTGPALYCLKDISNIWANDNYSVEASTASEGTYIYKFNVQVGYSSILFSTGMYNYDKDWTFSLDVVSSITDLSQNYSSTVEDVETVTLSSDNSWNYSWRYLPFSETDSNGDTVYYSYFVEESSVPEGYSSSAEGGWDNENSQYSYTITNTKEADSAPQAQVSVSKEWVDADGNSLETTPESVEIELWRYAVPEAVWKTLPEGGGNSDSGDAGSDEDSGDKVTLTVDIDASDKEEWWSGETYSFAKGTTVVVSMYNEYGGTDSSSEPSLVLSDNSELNVSSTSEETYGKCYVYQFVINSDVTLSGNLNWKAEDWPTDQRSVTALTTSSTDAGESTDTVDLTSYTPSLYATQELKSSNWTYNWENLPVYSTDSDGTKTYYSYFVKEVAVDGYESSVSGGWDSESSTYSYTVTNKLEDVTSITVNKKWVAADGTVKDDTVSSSLGPIEVKLYKAGDTAELYNTIKLGCSETNEAANEFTGWTYTWSNLPTGSYYVVETESDTTTNYNKTTYHTLQDGEKLSEAISNPTEMAVSSGTIVIQNWEDPTSIEVEKVWSDAASVDHSNDSVTMTLYSSTTAPGTTDDSESGDDSGEKVISTTSITVNVAEWKDESGNDIFATGGWWLWFEIYDESGNSCGSDTLYYGKTSYTVNDLPGVLEVNGESYTKTYSLAFNGGRWGTKDVTTTVDGSESPYSISGANENVTVNLKGAIGVATASLSYENEAVALALEEGSSDSGIILPDKKTFVEEQNIGSANNWAYKWSNLPKTNASGETLYYYVEETTGKSGYTASYSYAPSDLSNGISKVTVTNTPISSDTEEETTSITVQKKWVDVNGVEKDVAEDENLPAITVHLYKVDANGDSSLVESRSLGKSLGGNTGYSEDGWSYTWSNLSEGTYYVEEDSKSIPEGYSSVTYQIISEEETTGSSSTDASSVTAQSGTILITNIEKSTQISVEKKWSDGNQNHSSDSIKLQLYSSPTPVKVTETYIDVSVAEWVRKGVSSTTGTPEFYDTNAKGWIWIGAFACNSDGSIIDYSVNWNGLELNNGNWSGTIELPGIVTIGNTSETKYYMLVINTSPYKEDANDGNQYNNIETLSIIDDSDGRILIDGSQELHTVKFKAELLDTLTTEMAAVASLSLEDEISVASDDLEVVSSTTTVSGLILPDGAATVGDPVTLSGTDTNNWKYTWSNLPLTDEDGNLLYYFVEEIERGDYTTDYDYEYYSSDEDGQGIKNVIVTNTPVTSETVEVTAVKKWAEYSSESTYQNYVVTVQLFSNGGATGKTAELTAANDWTYTWTLPKGPTYWVEEVGVVDANSGKEITGFTVTSNTVEGDGTYTITITNTSTTGGYVLPSTGGTGTQPYTLGGMMLTVIASLLLYIKNKRRKEEQDSS